MELFDLGTALQTQLYGSRESLDDHPAFQDHPLLLSRLISKLTYCVRDAVPRYMSVDMSSSDGSFTIAVYTDDHLFYLAYDPTVDHITTSVVSRRSIRLLEVLSAPNFMAGDVPGTFLGSVSLEVSYETLKVRLPGDNHASEKNRQELDSFLTSLLRDLAQR